MVCTWLGELYHCSCLPVLPGPAWVLLSYVLHTFISGSVHSCSIRLGQLAPTDVKGLKNGFDLAAQLSFTRVVGTHLGTGASIQ